MPVRIPALPLLVFTKTPPNHHNPTTLKQLKSRGSRKRVARSPSGKCIDEGSPSKAHVLLVLNEKDCGCTTNGAKLHSAAKAETEHLMLGLTSNTNMHRTSGHMGKEGSPVRIGS